MKMIYKCYLTNSVQKDNWKNGCELKSWSTFDDSFVVSDKDELKNELECYGLDLSKFEVCDIDSNRLDYCRNEDNDGNEINLTEHNPNGFLVDYFLYIEKFGEITDFNICELVNSE